VYVVAIYPGEGRNRVEERGGEYAERVRRQRSFGEPQRQTWRVRRRAELHHDERHEKTMADNVIVPDAMVE
jgi:hypothetical protein